MSIQQQENTTELLIIGTTLIVLLLAITLIFLFLFIQKKKRIHYEQQQQFAANYAKELAKSQNEIRERALENISWEIHDNVGQVLSVSIMQLNRLTSKVAEKNRDSIQEVTTLVSKSLQDLRALSKSLNPVAIQEIGLIQALELEISRLNRLNFIKAVLHINNQPFKLDKEKEIILFRIVQEFIHNTLKHSKATELNVSLIYNNDDLEITVSDNGIGFDSTQNKADKGIGLLNMKGRAALINAEFKLSSVIGKGTTGYIKCGKEKVAV